MFFDKEFIAAIEEESPIFGILEICKKTFSELERFAVYGGETISDNEMELLLEATSLVTVVIESNDLKFDATMPQIGSGTGEIYRALYAYLATINTQVEQYGIQLKIDMYKNRYQAQLKSTFAYEFSQGDFDRIQKLVNELRDYIVANDNFEEDHRRRLLKRLELLQSELHKRVSNLDRFWGLVGDAGVMLGKFGNDAKPIVDRIRELAEIVWNTQARAEELPSSSKNPMIGYEETNQD